MGARLRGIGGGSDVLLVLPAYNEEEALAGVIANIRAVLPAVAVLVVDDGSSDATSAIAQRSGVRLITLPFNIGVGGALRAGLLVGQRGGFKAVVQCDADGQHPAESIPDLLSGLDGSDLVIGARFAGAGQYQVRGARNWAMVLLSRVMSRLHRTRLTDVTSGFRAFGPRAIEVLSRELPPDYLGDTVEALVIAKEYRLRVSQVPVAMRPRQGGAASHRPFRAALYLLRVLLILFLSMLRLFGERLRTRRR